MEMAAVVNPSISIEKNTFAVLVLRTVVPPWFHWNLQTDDMHGRVGGNIFFSPRTLGKIPILINIFQMGWFNHQPDKAL